MFIAGTKANRALAGAVNRRVSADASLIHAKAWLIRCGAVGLMVLLIGAGVGLAFLGVAKSRDASGAADRLAATLTRALEQAQLHAAIDPNSTVKLDPAAQVAMDPSASVKLDPSSTLPRPSRDQLKTDASARSGTAVQTNYTVFKVVRFGIGRVVTGYNFEPDSKLPDHQYCYFADGIDQMTFKTVHIAAEGRYVAPPNPPAGLDPAKAATECVWFDGRPTRF